MDLVEVEVLQGQAVGVQQLGHRVSGGHEQALVAVHVVHGGAARVDHAGERGQAVLGGPLRAAHQHGGGAIGERGRVAGGHARLGDLRRLHAEDGLEGAELLERRIGTQVLIAREATVAGDQVVEEAGVVRGGEVPVRGQGQLVLLLTAHAPLSRGQRLVLAHGQPGAGLAVAGRDRGEVRRTDRAERLEALHRGLRGEGAVQDAAQPRGDLDRGVRGGVDAAGDAGVDLAQLDPVGHMDHGLEAGGAGLGHVDRGGARVQGRAQGALAGEVEVPGELEHGAAGDLAELLALQAVAGHQALERRGEQVLVGDARVGAARTGEGDPVAAEDQGVAREVGLGHGVHLFVVTVVAARVGVPGRGCGIVRAGRARPLAFRRHAPENLLRSTLHRTDGT